MYMDHLVSAWDMSNFNVIPDIGWRELGNNGVGVNLDETNLVKGMNGGSALHFNGVDESIIIPNDSSLNFISETQAIAVSAWINLDAYIDKDSCIFGKPGTWILKQFADEKLYFGIYDSVIPTVQWFSTAKNVWEINKWIYIVFSWDGSIATWYVDGSIDIAGAFSPTAYSLNEDLAFAYSSLHWSGTDYYEGAIDEVKLFDSGLTNLQVIDLMHQDRRF